MHKQSLKRIDIALDKRENNKGLKGFFLDRFLLASLLQIFFRTILFPNIKMLGKMYKIEFLLFIFIFDFSLRLKNTCNKIAIFIS